MTIVPRRLVPDAQLTEDWVTLEGFEGGKVQAQCAIVSITVDQDSYRVKAAVTDRLSTEKVLFAVPLQKKQAADLLKQAASAADVTSLEWCGALTRSQAKELVRVREAEENEALREAGLSPSSADTHPVGKGGDPLPSGSDHPRVGGRISLGEAEPLPSPDTSETSSASERTSTRDSESPEVVGGAGIGSSTDSRETLDEAIVVAEIGQETASSSGSSSSSGEACKTPPPAKPKKGKKTVNGRATDKDQGTGRSPRKNMEVRSETPPTKSQSDSTATGCGQVVEDLRLELPGGRGDTKAALIKRQQEDQTLKDCIQLGKDRLRGYELREGLLVHANIGELGEDGIRVVVPKADRGKLLELAHEYGGHLGKKVKAKLNRLFTWPGLAGDVAKYVASCPECLRLNHSGNRPAELMERPIVDEPFRAVAVDIVGPLPKGKGGGGANICLPTLAWPQDGLRQCHLSLWQLLRWPKPFVVDPPTTHT